MFPYCSPLVNFVRRCFLGQTTHLGPDVILSIQPIWVPSPRDRRTTHLCNAASELRSGPAKPCGKRARAEPTKRHEHRRGARSGEGRTFTADHSRGFVDDAPVIFVDVAHAAGID